MRRLPQSLHDRAELLARSHSQNTVAEILGLRASTITEMKQRHWKAKGPDPRLRPVPTDFCIQARHMTHAQLCEHYRTSPRVISRWMREKQPRPRIKSKGRPRRASVTVD